MVKQEASGVSSGGKRIDDHRAWMGSAPKGSVMPEGSKMRSISEQDGEASVMRYEDTEEAIKRVQDKNMSQYKKHPMRDGYRQ